MTQICVFNGVDLLNRDVVHHHRLISGFRCLSNVNAKAAAQHQVIRAFNFHDMVVHISD